MRLPPPFPCNASTILDAAQQQTDPALWIDRTSSGSTPDAPEHCRDPILLETAPGGGGRLTVFGCHSAPQLDSVTHEAVDRLIAGARALQAVKPETLAQHQAKRNLARYIDALEEKAK